MIRTVLSSTLAALLLTASSHAFAEGRNGIARPETAAERAEEKAEDVKEAMEDVREARTPQERRKAKAELAQELQDQRRGKKLPVLQEGRASTKAAAPASGGALPALVAKYAAANGVPQHLAHGVVMVESRYKVRATGRGGYIGLMQLSYRTAQGMGYSGSRAGLYDPATNLQYGMKYLGQAYAQAGGNMCGAVSKYQGGHGVRGVTKAGAVYCGKVKKYMAQSAPVPRQVAELDSPARNAL